jgi:hypothetical protein
MTRADKVKKGIILVPTFLLAVLLIQQNYFAIFGMLIGVAVALSSCEMIQKAVNNSFVRKRNTAAGFFFIGFFFRFLILACMLYAAIRYFNVNVIWLTLSFTAVQLSYPFYLIHSLEKRRQDAGT